jgi:guanine deaminase
MTEIVRAQVIHTPRDPFREEGALEAFDDGAVAFEDGLILVTGSFAEVRRDHPTAAVLDTGGALLLPGLVDTHVHYPQLAVVGAMGLELLEWLELRALPEEARLADPAHAQLAAREFVHGLAASGTTTALVFGSHFPDAQEALFAEAERVGLRITSGLVVSDRNLVPALRLAPEAAYEAARRLFERWHNRGRLRYAVTPRFSASCSEAMLEACGALRAEAGDLTVTTHINESVSEVRAVAELFTWSRDYLETYERFGLVGPASVLAHDVHVTDDELRRLGAARASVAHCPASNAFLGSGAFPMQRHLEHGVRFALGTDVGAGTGLSLLKEGLMAYQVQRLLPDGSPLRPEHLLYLATSAGAEALGLGGSVGDLSAGKSADYVLVRPPPGGTLEAVLRRADSPEEVLGAVFTVAREESVAEVRVAGEPVYTRADARAPRGRDPGPA